ncbi:MAG TPA: low affinity iron permease family protein [Candidatus Thermoplasmatota archaeon]|nr:low affinity iron permease family protein [Candidatus Thermoplasmatota archaeon]
MPRKLRVRRSQIALDEDDPVRERPVKEWFSLFAARISDVAGSAWAFVGALAVVIVWAATGPVFGFSDTWQLIINTGTTIVTFLMVFLIQNTQNKDTLVIHVKLNELIASQPGASNYLIDLEDMSEADLERLSIAFERLADRAEEMDGLERMTVEQVIHAIRDEAAKRGVKRGGSRMLLGS